MWMDNISMSLGQDHGCNFIMTMVLSYAVSSYLSFDDVLYKSDVNSQLFIYFKKVFGQFMKTRRRCLSEISDSGTICCSMQSTFTLINFRFIPKPHKTSSKVCVLK